MLISPLEAWDGLLWHLHALHCKSRCTRIAGPGGNETTDCAGLALALTLLYMHAHTIDLFVFCKVKTGTAMAGPAVVAPTALLSLT